ncbi:thioredoxin-like domain-containing protein [Gloeobacter violaceus]
MGTAVSSKTPRVRAPELPPKFHWLNTDRPLRLKELRGRVVLLDFWTYCCINCLHILPDLKYLEDKYRDSLTVIGVHTAKFANEQDLDNIRRAILRHDIEHPVIVDESHTIWQSYTVRAWPTLVLIDPDGYYVGHASGEGNRDLLDQLIGELVLRQTNQGRPLPGGLRTRLEKASAPPTPLAFPGKLTVYGDRLFVSDSGHHRIVTSSLDGSSHESIGSGIPGWRDGNFEEAEFWAPQGLALSADGRTLFVCDTENHLLRKIDLVRRQVSTFAGTGEQSLGYGQVEGPGLEIPLNSPWDAVVADGALYVAMAGSHQIWKCDPHSGRISTFAGNGHESTLNGTRDGSAFAQPSGITTNDHRLFVADSESSSVRTVGIAEDITALLCGSGDLFGFGDQDGLGEAVLLQHPLGVHWDGGTLWLTDTYNHKIKRIDPESGRCETLTGHIDSGYLDGDLAEARFWEPAGLWRNGDRIYIADTNNHAIRVIDLVSRRVSTLKIRNLCAPGYCFPDSA